MVASLVASMVKNLPAMRETQVQSLGQEDPPWKREWQLFSVFLPGEFHGQRSKGSGGLLSMDRHCPCLVGCKELDMTEQLTHTHLVYFTWHYVFKVHAML